jgi:hypothetical protein
MFCSAAGQVESDDTKFVARAEKIKAETKAKHRLRMCRFLGRTLPMFALAAVWPLALVILIGQPSEAVRAACLCVYLAS